MFQVSCISEKLFDFFGIENNGKAALAARSLDGGYNLVAMQDLSVKKAKSTMAIM
jgi:hypothetical protein